MLAFTVRFSCLSPFGRGDGGYGDSDDGYGGFALWRKPTPRLAYYHSGTWGGVTEALDGFGWLLWALQVAIKYAWEGCLRERKRYF